MENKKSSCMYVLPLRPFNSEREDLELIEKNLNGNLNFKISKFKKDKNKIKAEVLYNKKNYEFSVWVADFDSSRLYEFMYCHIFREEEKSLLRESKQALITELICTGEALSSYHLHLKLIAAILPKNILAVYDSNSINILSGRWLEEAVKISAPPCPLYLFSIHAVPEKQGRSIWLHTHGLSRYGLNEIDILDSHPDFCVEYSLLLQNLALHLINGGDLTCAYIGILKDSIPIICSLIPDDEAEDYYKKNHKQIPEALSPTNEHRDKTYLSVFFFASPEDYKEKNLSHISIFKKEDLCNPTYFISDNEMDRMKLLAKERFSFVKANFKMKATSVLVKISIPVDKEFYSPNNKIEYVWFELKEIQNNELILKSIQDAYYIKNLTKDSIEKYTIESISDWIIYKGKELITPDDVYRL